MPFGGLAPVRALVVSGVGCAALLSLFAWAMGLLDAAGMALHVLDQLAPAALLGRFGPALCLVPLAARLRTPAIPVPYLALGAAMPILSFWGAHPYQIGILPDAATLGIRHWTAGIPTILFGATLSIIAARGRRWRADSPVPPYKAFASSLLAMVLVGVPAAYLLNGGDLRPWGLAALALTLAGALKGSLLAGGVTGLSAYVLTRGLPKGGAGAGAMLAVGLLSSPMASYPDVPLDVAPVWCAGFFLFALALAMDVKGRRAGMAPLAFGRDGIQPA